MSNDDEEVEGFYEPEYEEEPIQVTKDLKLTIFSVLPPPIEFLSRLHSTGREISGRQVWTGSLLLAQLFSQLVSESLSSEGRNDRLLDGIRILELGSGTGLLGLAVCRLSKPSVVVLTDGDEKAMELLNRNLHRNQRTEDSCPVLAVHLVWGCDESLENLAKACRSQSNFWNVPSQPVLFDCIVAGDVLYKTDLPSVFFSTARSLLPETGTLWLCHVPRANVTHDIVVSAAKGYGFNVDTIPLDERGIGAGCPKDDVDRAKVYRMSVSQLDTV